MDPLPGAFLMVRVISSSDCVLPCVARATCNREGGGRRVMRRSHPESWSCRLLTAALSRALRRRARNAPMLAVRQSPPIPCCPTMSIDGKPITCSSQCVPHTTGRRCSTKCCACSATDGRMHTAHSPASGLAQRQGERRPALLPRVSPVPRACAIFRRRRPGSAQLTACLDMPITRGSD